MLTANPISTSASIQLKCTKQDGGLGYLPVGNTLSYSIPLISTQEDTAQIKLIIVERSWFLARFIYVFIETVVAMS